MISLFPFCAALLASKTDRDSNASVHFRISCRLIRHNMSSQRSSVRYRDFFASFGSLKAGRGFAAAQISPTTGRFDAETDTQTNPLTKKDQDVYALASLPQTQDVDADALPAQEQDADAPSALDEVPQRQPNTFKPSQALEAVSKTQNEEVELNFLCLYVEWDSAKNKDRVVFTMKHIT
jgi:hypothetical protein